MLLAIVLAVVIMNKINKNENRYMQKQLLKTRLHLDQNTKKLNKMKTQFFTHGDVIATKQSV